MPRNRLIDKQAFSPLERAAMVGVLIGVVLSTGVNTAARAALGLPYVAIFGTYLIAAFGGLLGWKAVSRWDLGAWSRTRTGVFAFCIVTALLVALVYTVAVGALAIAFDSGSTANMIALPLDIAAFFVVRGWLRNRGQ